MLRTSYLAVLATTAAGLWTSLAFGQSAQLEASGPNTIAFDDQVPEADKSGAASENQAEGRSTKRLRPRIENPYEVRIERMPKASLAGDANRQIGYTNIGVRGVAPLLQDDRLGLGVLAEYDLHAFDTSGLDAWSDGDSVSLHRFSVAPLVSLRLSDSNVLGVRAGLVFASDLQEPDSDAWQPSVQVIDRHDFSPSTALLLGAGLSRQFLTVTPYPLLGFVWAPMNAPVRLDVLAPKGLRGSWFATDWLELALLGSFQGLVWQRSAQPEVPAHLVKSTQASAGLAARVKLVGPLAVEAAAGAQLLH